MLVLRIVAGVALGYGLILLLAWLLQERLAFPAPRASVPDPRRGGVANGERVELLSGDGTKLVGGDLRGGGGGGGGVPALLWFFGNGGDIAARSAGGGGVQ